MANSNSNPPPNASAGPDPASSIDMIDTLEQMIAATMQGLESTISNISGSLGSFQSTVDRINASMAGGGVGGSGAPPTAPVDFSASMDRLTRTMDSLDRNMATINANNTNTPAVPAMIGNSSPMLTAGQRAEMERHRDTLDSGRVNGDIPTFATYGGSLQPSPLSTLYRSNDLLGMNLGISDRAKPSDYPTHGGSIDIGQDLRQYLGANNATLRTLQGSLAKSYEYAQDKGQAGDDYRNAAFARTQLQGFFQQQEAVGTPIDRRTQGMLNVGLNERLMRDSSILTSSASNSLGRYVSAHQSGAIKYTPFIAMDSTGPDGTGQAGATVSTKKFMQADSAGSYAEGLLKTMNYVDQLATSGDVKQSAVNDIQTKLNSVRDNVVASIMPKEMQEKLTRVGVSLGSMDLRGVEKAQQAAANASDNLKKLGAKQQTQWLELDDIKQAKGDQSPEFISKANEINTTRSMMQAEERTMMTQEDKYRQGRSNIVNGMSNDDLQKMARSSDPEVRKLEQTLRSQDRLTHGMNVIGGTSPMTTAERVQGKMDSAAGGASEFAASMMKNLQWSLMFAFSGTVFQALSQIPTQATYETVQPVYSGISNIMGITPLKNEFMQFGSQAPGIISDLQTRTNSLQALLGSKSSSNQAVTSALDIAKAQPIQFGEAMEIMTAMSTYPSTKSQASNPQFQKTMFENVQLLSMLAPEQGTGGALFAIREMLSGQFRSLQMRFNMSPDLLAAYSGSTVGQMKSQSGPEMMNTMNRSLMGMFGGSEILMRRGAESKVQMNNIGDTLTASILNPMVNEVHTGLSQTVNRMMGTVSDGKGGFKDAEPGSMGSIGNMLSTAQKDALKNTALQSTATLMNVRYHSGDNVERLAERMTVQQGGSLEDNKRKIQTSYDTEVQKNAQSMYATPAGAQSLLLSGVNTILGEVLSTFTTSSGMGNMFNSFMSSFSGSVDAFKTESQELSGSGNEGERRKLAVDFVGGFMKDLQGALKSASSVLQSSGFGDVIKQVTDTVRIGAETVFAPIGEAIMGQTVKTAINLPGLMVGGALASAGEGVVNVGKDIFGGVANMYNSATGGEVKGAGTNVTQSLLEAGGTASQLMAWGSLRHLSTSPLTAAAKFGGWSLAARGMGQLSQGEGISGTMALAGATALNILPAIIPKSVSKWVDSAVRSQAAQDRTHGSLTGAGAGLETPPTNRAPMSRTSRAIGGVGGFLSSAFAVGSMASSYVDYQERGTRQTTTTRMGATGPVPVVSATPVTRLQAIREGLIGNNQAGQYARTGLLGSVGGRSLAMLGGGAAAFSGYSNYQEAKKEGGSGMEQFFSATQAVGGVAAAFGGFIPVIGTAVTALGVLASVVGTIGSHVTGSDRGKDAETAKDLAERRENVTRNVITNPVVDAQKQGGKTFDNASDNFGYKNVMTTAEHNAARKTSEQLTSFTEVKNKELADPVEAMYKKYLATDPKKAEMGEKEKESDLLDFKAKVHPLLLGELKGLENQKGVFQEDPNDKEKTINKLTPEYVDAARGRIKDVVKDNDMAESVLKMLVEALTSAKPERDKIQEEKTAQIKKLSPQYAEVAIQEHFFASTKVLDMPKDTNLNDNNVTSKSEKIAENLGIMQSLQKEGSDMIMPLRTHGVGIWGLEPEKVDAFEKTQGLLEAKMLEKGLIDPKQMVGAGGLEMMLRVGNTVGYDKASELGQMNLEKWQAGMMVNQGKAIKQMDDNDMPTAFSPGVIAQINLFNTAVNAINADSAVGQLDRVSSALNDFLKDVALSKVQPNSAKADEDAKTKEAATPAGIARAEAAKAKEAAADVSTKEKTKETEKAAIKREEAAILKDPMGEAQKAADVARKEGKSPDQAYARVLKRADELQKTQKEDSPPEEKETLFGKGYTALKQRFVKLRETDRHEKGVLPSTAPSKKLEVPEVESKTDEPTLIVPDVRVQATEAANKVKAEGGSYSEQNKAYKAVIEKDKKEKQNKTKDPITDSRIRPEHRVLDTLAAAYEDNFSLASTSRAGDFPPEEQAKLDKAILNQKASSLGGINTQKQSFDDKKLDSTPASTPTPTRNVGAYSYTDKTGKTVSGHVDEFRQRQQPGTSKESDRPPQGSIVDMRTGDTVSADQNYEQTPASKLSADNQVSQARIDVLGAGGKSVSYVTSASYEKGGKTRPVSQMESAAQAKTQEIQKTEQTSSTKKEADNEMLREMQRGISHTPEPDVSGTKRDPFYQMAYGALATAGPRPDYSGGPVSDHMNKWNGFDMVPNPDGKGGMIERPTFAGIENNVPMSGIFAAAQKNPGMAFETKGGIRMHVPTKEEEVRDWARQQLNTEAYNSFDKKRGGAGISAPEHPVYGKLEVPNAPAITGPRRPTNPQVIEGMGDGDSIYLRPIIINTTNTKVFDGGKG